MTTLPLPVLTPAETAILAAINAPYSSQRAYIFGDLRVPTLTTNHILVLVTRRYVPERLASGEVTIPGGRVVTRYIAKRGDNIPPLVAATKAALEDQILTFVGGEIGPFVFESHDPVTADETWFVATDTWTC